MPPAPFQVVVVPVNVADERLRENARAFLEKHLHAALRFDGVDVDRADRAAEQAVDELPKMPYE